MQKVLTHPTQWEPKNAKVAINICTEACIVPSDADSARLSYGHVVVLDDFFDETMRKDLFDCVNIPQWREDEAPPETRWQRATCDQAGLPPSWGLKARTEVFDLPSPSALQDSCIKELLNRPSPAMVEIHTRLCKLYPEV